MKNLLKSSLAFVLIFLFQNLSSNEVNIYTSRHYDSDDLLYKDFSNSTGIKVNIISGKGEALIERLKSEGSNSSADIFLTSDAGNLWKVQKEGLFKSIASKEIMQSVPVNLRGPNNEWIGIAKRARVIFYNPDNVVSKDIENLSYEDLAKETREARI